MTKITIRVNCENSPKQQFLRDFNIAFATGDAGYIVENVSEDIHWIIYGDKEVIGKRQFAREIHQMKEYIAKELIVNSIITHGKEGAVNGQIIMNQRTYSFCDVYQFSSASGTQIRKMESYVIETTGSSGPAVDLNGSITHTEFISSDPQATKEWCARVMNWHFMPEFPSPAGPYHLFAYSDQGGGGIRATEKEETPGTISFIKVADTDTMIEKALEAGATIVAAPETVMEGVRIAMVRAPGGVLIGFSGPGKL